MTGYWLRTITKPLQVGEVLLDGFPFGWQTTHVIPYELLHVAFTQQEEVATYPSEFVRSTFGHLQSELLHLLFID
jgi:hypothetical protein